MMSSVLIPTFNSSQTIEMTLETVLRQTCTPGEILVWDDGSCDNTLSLLKKYESQISIFTSQNRGVAATRNQLCQLARGDLLAFLDHDDLWHPDYLRIQTQNAREYPGATGFYTGHINVTGYGGVDWQIPPDVQGEVEVLSPTQFLMEYNRATGRFGSMSYCCIRRETLQRVQCDAFHVSLSGVDDSYLASLLPLIGDVVYTPQKLAAYRIIETAQSANRLKMVSLWVLMFEILLPRYDAQPNRPLAVIFRKAYAAKRRQYARLLMGAAQSQEARRHFVLSIGCSKDLISCAKSMSLLLTTFLPRRLQPRWPSSQRM